MRVTGLQPHGEQPFSPDHGRKRRTPPLCGNPGAARGFGLSASQARRRKEAKIEAQKLERGRLIDHIQLVVKDLAASRRFYEAVLGAIGVPIGGSGEDHFWADELFVSTAQSPAAQGRLTGRHHLAFQAVDRTAVEAFHRAALASGGTDNGAPGERPYHPGYYAAFALDPDGNNIEVVFHGEATRSAPSVTITF